ncbi:MAG: ATPase domain-containing protein [Pseudomonadota bacterium]
MSSNWVHEVETALARAGQEDDHVRQEDWDSLGNALERAFDVCGDEAESALTEVFFGIKNDNGGQWPYEFFSPTDLAWRYYQQVVRNRGKELRLDAGNRGGLREFVRHVRDGSLRTDAKVGWREPWRPFFKVARALSMLRGPLVGPMTVSHVPSEAVLAAKLFGLKTDIAGLDDIFGGGLLVQTHAGDPEEGGAPRLQGTLGVVRGRFGSGKSTLAFQLGVEMARKGGLGVVMVLEQSAQEVLSQARHFGWVSGHDLRLDALWDGMPDEEIKRVGQRRGLALEESPASGEALFHAIIENCKKLGFTSHQRGLLYIHRPQDATLARFRALLETFTESMSGVERAHPLRFILVDPIDSVQLSRRQAEHVRSTQEVRNYTEQVLRSVTQKGISLWLTTHDVDPDTKESEYSFVPNIGDVVMRLSQLTIGQRFHGWHDITEPRLRLFEVEKARVQPFVKGIHLMEIKTGEGVRIIPSGETHGDLTTWVQTDVGATEPFGTGVPALDFALGKGGIPPLRVTTFMGPTGSAKTELAVLWLVHDKLQGNQGRGNKRSLFVSFRDDWKSINDILCQSVGTQLGLLEKDPKDGKPVKPWEDKGARDKGGTRLQPSFLADKLDLLELPVRKTSSGEILDQLRRTFKSLPPDRGYDKVVIDNIAYMDLTTPLVRTDEHFVPQLLELLERERVTPIFITSLVEGVISESRVQTQIRDASHNLVVFKPNRFRDHHFIAVAIKKSVVLRHQPQPLELLLGEYFPPFEDPLEIRKHVLVFLKATDQSLSGNVGEVEKNDFEKWWSDEDRKRRFNKVVLQSAFADRLRNGGTGDPLYESVGSALVSWGESTNALSKSREAAPLLADLLHRLYVHLCGEMNLVVRILNPGKIYREGASGEGATQEVLLSDIKYLAQEVLRKFPASRLDEKTSNISRGERARRDWLLHSPYIAEKEPGFWEPLEVQRWRALYRLIMDALEIRAGISIRLHSLDGYENPLGEDKLERIGAARAPSWGR